ncbi:zinc-binding protein A33-like isoform X2 [Elgaria multicarinata webbii]|uniref:zinc-binding protein A33-like isoform X2 n=1 Tax=Elgaria multicarinata webbii TaxID=159646 RepID=UPI002FCCE3BB
MAEGFHEDLTCSVCLDLFTQPVLLSCGHCFCQNCITSFWGSQERDSTCPECREPCPDRQYTPNRLLGNLAKRAWAVRREAKGSTVQNDAEISEKKEQAERETEDGHRVLHCEAHGDPFELFCITDETSICFRCVHSPVHAGHRFSSLKDVAQSYKGCAASLRKSIEDTFSELHQALHDRQAVMLVELDKDEKGAHDNMEGRLQQIRGELHAAQEKMSQGKTRMELNNTGAFLLGIRQFLDILPSKTENQSEGDKDDLAVLHKELHLGRFKGPNQHLACRPLSPIFMQELEPVQLDPYTAHPVFAITNKGTCVMVQEPLQNYGNNPQRFRKHWIVRGTNGFVAGRHYWEIETDLWTGWFIGVAAESIEREIKLGAEYFMDKAWFLNLRKTISSGGNIASCCRIGVYLDYEEGQVSFYDAVGGSHLLTRRAHFKEKVYPFFLNVPVQTEKDVFLRICQK